MALDKHSVVPVEESDLPTIAQFIYASNLPQATNRFLFSNWPNESTQLSLYLDTVKQALKDSNNEMFKVVDDVSGETIASLVLTRQKPNSAGSSSSKEESTPTGMNPEVYSVLKHAATEIGKDMAEIDHFVLTSIFVKNSSRNRGIGSQLVQLCLDKAKSAQLPLFLCSVPSAHSFYLKLGFRDIAHADVDLRRWGPEYGGYGVYRLFGMLVSN